MAWNVTVDRVTETPTSLLAFGHHGRQAVVLKVVKTLASEWWSGEILNAFGGRGVVRVLDIADGAVLLEQLQPGDSLLALSLGGEDQRATAILTETIAAMSPSTCPEWVPDVADWGRSFLPYRRSGDAQVPDTLVSAAERIYGDLCGSQQHVRLLHGDLHHENVLHDHRRGWLAIDPKGVRGELEYELGAALRNPCERADLFAQPDVIRRRVGRLTQTLSVDPTRVLRWAFAQAVLAAIWQIEDGTPVGPDHRWLAFARAIGTLCGEA